MSRAKLTPYQKQALKLIKKHFKEGSKIVIQLPRGCGKTEIINQYFSESALINKTAFDGVFKNLSNQQK